MNILVTGSRGFVGRNLVENLKNIRDGKDQTRNVLIEDIYEYNRDTDPSLLAKYCAQADFIFHLAGVNRPKEPAEFMEGNVGFSEKLLQTLAHENAGERTKKCGGLLLASSVQAGLQGRFRDSAYGRSKLEAEKLFSDFAKKTGARVLIYRLPNLFGKWCRPNYNSAVATFCHNIANGLPIQVNDRNTELELLYIDDLIDEMIVALEGGEHRCTVAADGKEREAASRKVAADGTPEEVATGRLNGGEDKVSVSANLSYCFVPVTHQATLGEIVDLLTGFQSLGRNGMVPEIPSGSLAKKLYATYLSYLPKESIARHLDMHVDNRGVFTELLKTQNAGQISINIARPGIVRGEHWHNSKSEIFIVVSGHGLIQERRIGSSEIIEFEVSGEKITAVQMLPGYTHNIINLSETENLVTVMWANEPFDAKHPDTFYEKVEG
ncbi:MAG: SDR family oxidoreductase [Lachnospiraceae bacterium]|nr:SDR family oxidoreductase [Lachnospiraceae bacterium]MBF1012065.1 SDR family oxidoreductase [Lachnospiraceae bacterium]